MLAEHLSVGGPDGPGVLHMDQERACTHDVAKAGAGVAHGLSDDLEATSGLNPCVAVA